MCNSCDKLRSQGIQIPEKMPDHSAVTLEGGIPVIVTQTAYYAVIGGQLVQAMMDGGVGVYNGVFHFDSLMG